MANPSLKKGYLSIATELVEQLAKVNLSGEEWRIMWVVMRSTWGWQDGDRKRDWDKISLTQFALKTGMDRSNVRRNVTYLVNRKFLEMRPGRISAYKINQDYEQWLSKEAVGVKQPRGVKAPAKLGVKAPAKLGVKALPTIYSIEKIDNIPAEPVVFDLSKALGSLAEAKSPVHRIAGQLIRGKGHSYANKEQFNAAFKRALRPAQELSGYSSETIELAIAETKRQAEDLGFDWQPQTVVKNIERVANKVQQQRVDPAILRARQLQEFVNSQKQQNT